MIYLYRRQVSEGARELADALNDANIPARFTQGGLLREPRVLERLAAGRDRLVAWGDYLAGQVGLNNVPLISKYQDAIKLREANVPTIEVALQRPPQVPAGRGDWTLDTPHTRFSEQEVRGLINRMQAWLAAPLPPLAEWLGRRNNHIGGADLLVPPQRPDYWTKRETIAQEFRLHVFRGKSIRAGQKMRRDLRPDGRPSHEWIRSFDAGWIIAYENFKSTRQQREIAANAVAALGLDFGAVDLAQRADGSLFVLEVNRAPGIEGGTVNAYVGAIGRWMRGEE